MRIIDPAMLQFDRGDAACTRNLGQHQRGQVIVDHMQNQLGLHTVQQSLEHFAQGEFGEHRDAYTTDDVFARRRAPHRHAQTLGPVSDL